MRYLYCGGCGDVIDTNEEAHVIDPNFLTVAGTSSVYHADEDATRRGVGPHAEIHQDGRPIRKCYPYRHRGPNKWHPPFGHPVTGDPMPGYRPAEPPPVVQHRGRPLSRSVIDHPQGFRDGAGNMIRVAVYRP